MQGRARRGRVGKDRAEGRARTGKDKAGQGKAR
jgi:hypothetical protein